LWRGSLLPLDREAVPKPAKVYCLKAFSCQHYDRFARARTDRREQAPSPQVKHHSPKTTVFLLESATRRLAGAFFFRIRFTPYAGSHLENHP